MAPRSVAIADVKPRKEGVPVAQSVAAEDAEAAARVTYIECDVSNATSVAAAVKRAAIELGNIDILVNNAGINIPRLLVDPAGKVTGKRGRAQR